MNIANSLKNNADIDKRDSALININETELAELKSITEKAAELYSGSPDGEIITALTDKKIMPNSSPGCSVRVKMPIVTLPHR